MVWVQFPGIPSYDENQVALVIRDRSEFSRRVPVIIGTPTIDQVVWALKESELDTILEEWQRAQLNPYLPTLTKIPWTSMRRFSLKTSVPFPDLNQQLSGPELIGR